MVDWGLVVGIIFVVIVIRFFSVVIARRKKVQQRKEAIVSDSRFLTLTKDKLLLDMEREKPIRFSSEQLKIATDNFTHLLGSGGFGAVYKGIFNNGIPVAVKILNGSSDKRIEEQFLAEVSNIGRRHNFNLVRLYGFCFDNNLRALVYEYMVNGSLDGFLFQEKNSIELDKLHAIAVGMAKGIAYLHEGCEQMLIHYDIKPRNILLDAKFNPKVADFGLAKLCNRDNTHVSNAGGRGTPGYAAPELWMPCPITCKCDVYSFGMLLFEIIGRRRTVDVNIPESQEWFPKWAWNKFENEETVDFMVICGVEEKDRKMVDRMVMVGFWCVQYQPESRPCMSLVVKMLEGGVGIEKPINPFSHSVMGSRANLNNSSSWIESGLGSKGTQAISPTVTGSPFLNATPIMRKYGIEMAST